MSKLHKPCAGMRFFYCPGCKCSHAVTIKEDGSKCTASPWDWNGSDESPTFSPSILVHSHPAGSPEYGIRRTPQCHSFIKDGKIQFLSDCEHELKGQTVDIPEWKLEE